MSEYLGRIRSRVGISNANNYGLGNISDRYQLIKAVLNERQVELAYEGKRSWDLKRWLLFEEVLDLTRISVVATMRQLVNMTLLHHGVLVGKFMMAKMEDLNIQEQIMC